MKGSHPGFEEDVTISLTGKTDPFGHHKRENYWARTLKTIASFSLNVEEIYWVAYTYQVVYDTHFSSVLLVFIIAESM